MRYEGPIYRPPSEAHSLLIQTTAGCPHNKCTFCMIYKKGPGFRIRPTAEIIADMQEARQTLGDSVRTMFFPAGNSIAMPTDQLAEVCREARDIFPLLERITVYGSARFILAKGEGELRELSRSGLSRVHVGLESGSDEVLKRINKGASRQEQIAAGQMLVRAGIENSTYVMLGIGGRELTSEHARETASALSAITPDMVRIRTFLPKMNTPLLRQIEKGEFEVVSPHEALHELRTIISGVECETRLASDHYTNYVNAQGSHPRDRQRMLGLVDRALAMDEGCFRPVYVGTQ